MPSKVCDPRPIVRVGIPYAAMSPMLEAARGLNAPVLYSTGALYRKERGGLISKWPDALWRSGDVSLDSGGFVAMLQGGYRWTTDEYIEWLFNQGGEDVGRPFPFTWYTAMDYCCESQIAKDRSEVERRIDMTTSGYEDCLASWLYHMADEGYGRAAGIPEPMPCIQGRLPGDYVRSAREILEVRTKLFMSKSGSGLRYYEEIGMNPTDALGLPDLIGVGSVCTRDVLGEDGVLPVLQALDAYLPKYVKLHLFGVKGDTLTVLNGPLAARIHSVDSMAWDDAARRSAQKLRKAGAPLGPGQTSHYNTDMRAEHLRDWYLKQKQKVR